MVPACFYQVVDGTRVHVISRAYADKYTIILHINDITAAKSVADDVIDRCYNACRGPIESSHDNGRITQNGELRTRPENINTLFYRIRSTWTVGGKKCLLLFYTAYVRRNGIVE